MPNYTATVGFCPAGKLVSTKAECLKLKAQLDCKRLKSFDLPGCSKCYTNSDFSVVDTAKVIGTGSITVVGTGRLRIIETGFPQRDDILLSNTPHVIDLRVSEGTEFKLHLYPVTLGSLVYIAGFLSGPTFGGEFTTDLRRIILHDELGGRKPRSSGTITVSGSPVIKMSPLFGQTIQLDQPVMKLVANIPFSFVDTTSEEASLCIDGPYSTKVNNSMDDPCFITDAAPGNYNPACLQNIWLSNGCNISGTGYPNTPSKQSSLMIKLDGTPRTSNEIAEFIYNKALIYTTGVDAAGITQSFTDQSAASVFCTGVAIASPCEGPTKTTGPLSTDCIIYLWRNEGAGKSIGATYTGSGSSLVGNSPQYCTASGLKSPVDANNNIRAAIVADWKTKGGVEAVKRLMKEIYDNANAAGLTDAVRMPFFNSCYGPMVPAPPTPAAPLSRPQPPPVYTCPTGSTTIVNSPLTVRRNNIITNNFAFTPDFTLTAYITPRGAVGDWSSLLHFTTGQDSGPFGARALGIWFYSGSITKLAVHIDHSNQPGWAARVDDQTGLPVSFAIGRTSVLVITCNGPNITITVDGQRAGSFTRDGLRYSGPVTVYGSDPWWTPANCTIEKLCYQALPPYYPVCDVGSEQGMPACQNLSVRSGPSAPACGEMVTVFGKPNFSEYNFAIPIGRWNTLSEIRSIPGNRGYTIYGNDGNVSFAFPKNCPLKLTINNGDNFSGPVTYVFTKTCRDSILSGACGQITYDRRWDYARSIKCERA